MLSLFGKSAILNTNEISQRLLDLLERRGDTEAYNLFSSQFSIKRVSGDLDRLFRMGFLGRKRVKRIIYPKGSLPFVRGFAYDYYISKQGWQYLDYLANPRKEQTDPIDDLLHRAVARDLHAKTPKLVVDFMEEMLFQARFQNKGRHNRFPRNGKN